MAHFIRAAQNPASTIAISAIAFEYQQLHFKTLSSTCVADGFFQRFVAVFTNWGIFQDLIGHGISPGQIVSDNLSIKYYSENRSKFNISREIGKYSNINV